MSGRLPTKRQLHAHTICKHALELLRDQGTDKSVASFPVREVVAEPFTVWRSIAGIDIWHEESGKVLNMAKCDSDQRCCRTRGEVLFLPVSDVHATLTEIGLARFIIWLRALTAIATSTGCAPA